MARRSSGVPYVTPAQHSAIDHDNLPIDHDGLENVTGGQHHLEDHAPRHGAGGADELTQFARSALTPADNGRALDTNFQPSATRPVWVSYCITLGVIGASPIEVRLLSDASDPPTTERTKARVNNPGVGSAHEHEITFQLSYLVPAGHYVRLDADIGSVTLVGQVEIPL